MIEIREANTGDIPGIWRIFRAVVSRGDTYAYDPGTTEDEFRSIWFGPDKKTFVAEESGQILGTYILKPNQPGLGDHIANAGYMVGEEARGKGIGRKLCEHSMEAARELGYKAMQFNFVVSTNAGAVRLWEKLGFEIIGTIPEAFRSPSGQLVAAHIMHRKL